MTNKKNTRRALFTSIMSLILCFAMLMGTTFAWFTDSVTSATNLIQSGNLDVELYHSDKAERNQKVTNNTMLFDDVTLWEPGAVVYENFVVKNEGNLALKYQLNLNFANATDNGAGKTLADVLKVSVVEGGFNGDRTAAQGLTYGYNLSTFALEGALSANEASKTYGIVIYWQPSDIDNTFNLNNREKNETGANLKPLTIDLGVNLFATQKEHEFDSFGPEYDNGSSVFAAYSFDSIADLLIFAPTADDAASSGLSLTEDGKAQIDASGAWYTVDADLAEHEYSIAYDLDITNVSVGENITVDTGDSKTWGSTPIMLERGSTKVYYGLAKNEEIGTLEGTVLHIIHDYTFDAAGQLNIKTTISDGVEKLTYSKAVNTEGQTALYWDIYSATDAGKATMDNFTLSVGKANIDNSTEFKAALDKGGNIVVDGEMNVDGTVDVPTWTDAPAEYVIDATWVNSLSGGTYVLDEASKYGIVALVSAGETLALSDMNVTANSQWPMYLANFGGEITVSDVTINAESGAGIYPYGTNGTTTLNNVKVNQERLDPSYASSTPWAATAVASSNGHNLLINSGTYIGSSWAVYSYNSGSTITINDGTFKAPTVIQLDGVWSGTNKSVATINGGNFDGAIKLDWGTNPPELYITGGNFTNFAATVSGAAKLVITGGTFDADPSQWVADGYAAINNNGTWNIIALSGTTVLPSGTVLDLKGVEVTGTIVAEGNLTIMGDTKIKTLKATNGGTITVEEGKTLTLNDFSFGSKDNNTSEYTITGGTVTANYGFFQHGKYDLHSDFETGYMYYSYGSDITVYGNFHSRGEGDGLDYVRGKVTIANGGRSIHDKSLWVGQPASWGEMNATLVVADGGYLQANSLSVYSGSTMQIDAQNATAGEVTNIVCNTLNNEGTIEAINNDNLTATVNGNKIVLN